MIFESFEKEEEQIITHYGPLFHDEQPLHCTLLYATLTIALSFCARILNLNAYILKPEQFDL